MSIRIICDSSCDLPINFFESDGIDFSIAPLTLNVGGREFVDDENIDTVELMKAIKNCKTATSSACPSPEMFIAEMEKSAQSICITMTSALSGTFNSARVAAETVNAKGNCKATVVDSLATSSTMILMAFKLKSLIEQGTLSYETICEKLNEYRDTLKLRFLVQDLSTLIKNGRMSRIAGIVATTLSLCPLCGENGKGEIKVYEKVRGAKNALSKLADTVSEKVSSLKQFPVIITHCNNEEHATHLKNLLVERFGLNDIKIFKMRGLTSFYANDKGIIMSF